MAPHRPQPSIPSTLKPDTVLSWITLPALLLLASLAQADERTVSSVPPIPPGLSIGILEQLPELPGDIGPLPNYTPPVPGTAEAHQAELGQLIFFDPRFSKDGAISCAACHAPSLAFADGKKVSTGLGDTSMSRNSPTLLNSALSAPYFWDGRAATLEDQAKMPIISAGEMGLANEHEFGTRLHDLPEYAPLFAAAFAHEPNELDAYTALAAFERTLMTPNARFDTYARGQRYALTEQEKLGLTLFVGKASCTQCHLGRNFTDNQFHALGNGAEDAGRFQVTGDKTHRGAFKTPTLRNVALTAPYMHDGSLGTLMEVIEFYDQGGGNTGNKSPLIFELGLSQEEKQALVAFLGTLTGDMPAVEVPKQFRALPLYAAEKALPAMELDYLPEAPTSFESLADLMVRGIHEQFTFLGFSVWHTRAFSEKRREKVQATSRKLEDLVSKLPALAPPHHQQFYQDQIAEILGIVQSLRYSSDFGSLAELRALFSAMEKKCIDCHQTFRPDLVWVEKVEE